MSKTVISQIIDTERLKRVKKNRQIQLQRWDVYENEIKQSQMSVNNGKSDGNKCIAFSKEVIFLDAVSRNDIKEVNELLIQGVNPNVATVDGLTGLHQCCIDNFIEMAELLLRNNANVNAVDSEMWTPLHAAATCDNAKICGLLSKHGCDFLALNSDGNMPYDICEGDNSQRIIESEMDKKGVTQQQIDDARMALEQTMMRDVRVVFQHKGNLNKLDCQGAALIHIACSLGYKEVVQTLLEAGANHSLQDSDGWMPIHLAALWNQVDIVEILAVFGADLDVTNSNGDSIFDLCEPEIKDRFIYIKEHISDIQKTFDFNKLLPYKGFRRSRGSSVRRSSVRHKNMLSKKESKGEFIALTAATISSDQDGLDQLDQESVAHIPSTIDENSDVDGQDGITLSSNNIRNSIKDQTNFFKDLSIRNHIQRSVSKNNSSESKRNVPNQIHSLTSIDSTKQKQRIIPNFSDQIEHNNRLDDNSILIINENEPFPHTSSENANRSLIETFDKPKYFFKSTTESWDTADEGDGRSRRRCCRIL